MEAALAEEGHQITLQPGDDFQPAQVRLPTFPEADFLWPGLGTIVSARVRDLLTEKGFSGVKFCKVTWGKIGERRPIPRGGEPESLLKQMPTYTGKQPAPQYFEMVVTTESKIPPGVVSRSLCESCGREDLDTGKRVFDVRPEQWNGSDIFLLATTLYMIVTDGVKETLERAHMTNLRFAPLPIADAGWICRCRSSAQAGEVGDLLVGAARREAEQELESVAVAVDRVRARAAS